MYVYVYNNNYRSGRKSRSCSSISTELAIPSFSQYNYFMY